MIVTASHGSSWTEKSSKSKERFVVMACGCTWVMPILTSFIALGKGYYTAVSGNWCWLTPNPVYVRYVLTHEWRFLFMFIEIGLYTYLYIHLRRQIKVLSLVPTPNTPHSRTSLRNRFCDLEWSSGSIQMHELPIKIPCGQSESNPYIETKNGSSSPQSGSTDHAGIDTVCWVCQRVDVRVERKRDEEHKRDSGSDFRDTLPGVSEFREMEDRQETVFQERADDPSTPEEFGETSERVEIQLSWVARIKEVVSPHGKGRCN
ncbi:hypothetical protein DFS33DRAFT_1401496 [Desarmillaria ectypa]|nr:hypothetical protein DFS33DRAFT_1401496 [Desarmillaria ectypa]